MSPKLPVADQVRHDIIIGVRKAERGDPDVELTPPQTATLAMIRAFIAEHGYSPTLRQVADGSGCVLSTAAYRLSILVTRGYLRHEPGSPRTLVVVDRRPPAPPIEAVTEPCAVCGRTS